MIISYNDLFLFRFYLIVILVILLYICIILSNNILNILYRYLIYFRIFFGLSFYPKSINLIVSNYIQNKQWFLCISLLELELEGEKLDQYLVYDLLAYCYKQMAIWRLSNYYYNILLLRTPKDIDLLKVVANLNQLMNNRNQASNLYARILSIDPEDKLAKDYLNQNY